MTFHARIATPKDWPLIEAVLAPSGGCQGCWCYNHHHPPGGSGAPVGEPARAQKRLLIERGAAHGVIGFAGEKPAGWCAFDRKAMIPGHDCVGDSLSGHETEQWVIHCFYTLPDYRGHGLARFMLAHALAYLSDQGAGSVEAYPTPLRDDGRCFLFAGTYSMYQSFGFEHAGDIDERYCRMRKQLP